MEGPVGGSSSFADFDFYAEETVLVLEELSGHLNFPVEDCVELVAPADSDVEVSGDLVMAPSRPEGGESEEADVESPAQPPHSLEDGLPRYARQSASDSRTDSPR